MSSPASGIKESEKKDGEKRAGEKSGRISTV